MALVLPQIEIVKQVKSDDRLVRIPENMLVGKLSMQSATANRDAGVYLIGDTSNVRVAGITNYGDATGRAIWLSKNHDWTIGLMDGYIVAVPHYR